MAEHGLPDPSDVDRPWIARYNAGVPPTYRYPDVPLTRLLDDAARDHPATSATYYRGASLDYDRLQQRVDGFATGLADLGVGHGTAVALCLPNLPAYVIAAFASWRLGAVVVQADPTLVPDELSHRIADSGARVLICTDELEGVAGTLLEELPRLRHVITTAATDWSSRRLSRRARRSAILPPGFHAFTDLLKTPPAVRQAGVVASDLAVIQYTGGTTAASKGVMLSHANLVANSYQARLWVPDLKSGREVLVAATPFTQSYGLTLGLLTGVLAAATLLLVDAFEPRHVLSIITAERGTIFPGVPEMYTSLLDHPDIRGANLSSLRAAVSGAAPLHARVRERFEQLTAGGALREGYGLSEAGPLTHANPIYGDPLDDAIGVPVTDTVAIVVDPEDPSRLVPDGETGELAVAGPQVMRGYWRNDAATKAAMRDGWLLTGDLAHRDPSGVFRLVDRKVDVVTTKGQTVYPRQVEEALRAHPAVRSATVVGAPDPQAGEVPVAFVVLFPNAPVSSADLMRHCRHLLPAYAVPVEIDLRAELPHTRLGKMLRRTLREELIASRGLDHESEVAM